MKKIWVLTLASATQNNKDGVFVTFWHNKPTIKQLRDALFTELLHMSVHDYEVMVGLILNKGRNEPKKKSGKEEWYTLKEYTEGKLA